MTIFITFVVYLRPFTLFWWNIALNIMKERNWSIEFFYFVFGESLLLA